MHDSEEEEESILSCEGVLAEGVGDRVVSLLEEGIWLPIPNSPKSFEPGKSERAERWTARPVLRFHRRSRPRLKAPRSETELPVEVALRSETVPNHRPTGSVAAIDDRKV